MPPSFEYDLPVFYKLRITLVDPTEQSKDYEDTAPHIRVLVASKIKEWLKTSRVTGGVEWKNGQGEVTYPHCHFHFTSREKRDTIVRRIKENFHKEMDFKLLGVQNWSLKPETYVDEHKFFRYPLKQNFFPKLCSGFSEDELQELRLVALENYKIATEINQNKADHKANSENLYDRLEHFLEKSTALEEWEVLDKVIEFYMKEKRPMNQSTLLGYTHLYMIKHNILTIAEYRQKILSHHKV